MLSSIYDYKTQLTKLADELLARGEVTEAEFILRRMVEHYPSLGEGWRRLANVLVKLERFDEAEETIARACAIDPHDAESYLVKCSLVEKLRGEQEAEKLLRAGVAGREQWWKVRVALAQLLVRTGREAESESILQSLLDEQWDADIAADLAGVKLRLGKLAEAQALIVRFSSEGAAPQKLFDTARALVEAKAHDAAWQFIQALLGAGIIDEQVFQSLGELLTQIHGPESGLQFFESVLKQSNSKNLRESAVNAAVETRAPALISLSSKRRAVFVAEIPKVRETKLAAGLRAFGWEVILLCKKAPDYDISLYFDAMIPFGTAEEAQYLARRLHASIFHVFASAVDETALSFIKDKPGVTLFDVTDVFDGMIYEHPALMEAQRYCFLNADGLVCRDLQTNLPLKRAGLSRPKHTLFFPEFCWNTTPKIVDRPGPELHIVQAGWIDLQGKTERKESSAFDLFQAFAQAGIHVHLYKHMLFGDADPRTLYGDLYELQMQYGCVHIHQTVPVNRICSELTQYHIGMNIAAHTVFMSRETKHSKNAYHFSLCGSSRNVDYLEAGLPVLQSADLTFQKFMLKRMGVGFPLKKQHLNDLKNYLSQYNSREAREKIYSRREKYSVASQSHRLASFYDACLGYTEPVKERAFDVNVIPSFPPFA
ncbi:MAG: tetratricopeptide repeat protein [Bdellovibrionota bacterium]